MLTCSMMGNIIVFIVSPTFYSHLRISFLWCASLTNISMWLTWIIIWCCGRIIPVLLFADDVNVEICRTCYLIWASKAAILFDDASYFSLSVFRLFVEAFRIFIHSSRCGWDNFIHSFVLWNLSSTLVLETVLNFPPNFLLLFPLLFPLFTAEIW